MVKSRNPIWPPFGNDDVTHLTSSFSLVNFKQIIFEYSIRHPSDIAECGGGGGGGGKGDEKTPGLGRQTINRIPRKIERAVRQTGPRTVP